MNQLSIFDNNSLRIEMLYRDCSIWVSCKFDSFSECVSVIEEVMKGVKTSKFFEFRFVKKEE